MRGTRLIKLTAVALVLFAWPSARLPVVSSQAAGPRLSGVVPDPYTPIKPAQTDFDNFAWQVFVALNWPANPDGSPDLRAFIGQRPGAPRVWELYTDPNDIFYKDGCNQPRLARRPAFEQKVLSRISKRIEKLAAGTDTQAAANWPLVDQARNFALYESLINDTQTNYICAQRLTSAEKIGDFVAGGKKVSFPFGSLEVKAAWRLFPADTPPEVLARYHTREATIAIPEVQPTGQPGSDAPRPVKSTLTAKVGLVGLHITYKIRSQPRWIWATFEQVDNYKVDYKPLPNLKPTFSSGNAQPGADTNNRQPAQTNPPDLHPTSYVWSGAQPTAGNYAPVEVASCPNEVPPSPVNAAWQERLAGARGVANSPWQYYRLNSVQWFDGRDRIQPRNTDGAAVLRNSVLETYLLGDQTIANQVPAIGVVASDVVPFPPQGTLPDTIVATEEANKYPEKTGTYTWSSCVVCHQMALYGYAVKDCKTQDVMTDYSFVFRSFLPQNNKPSTCPKG
ncbi:MAG: hypothetical protein JOZ96_02490 [Acidobacteria bacterium]|nr:hypothetical protein [Acidobacteriota bacterium]